MPQQHADSNKASRNGVSAMSLNSTKGICLVKRFCINNKNVHDMKNIALLGKWLWRCPQEQHSLWASIIQSKLGHNSNSWDATISPPPHAVAFGKVYLSHCHSSVLTLDFPLAMVSKSGFV